MIPTMAARLDDLTAAAAYSDPYQYPLHPAPSLKYLFKGSATTKVRPYTLLYKPVFQQWRAPISSIYIIGYLRSGICFSWPILMLPQF